MTKRLNLAFSTPALALLVMLVSGCNKPGPVTKVEDCHTFDGKADECKDKEQNDGAKCVYDSASSKCNSGPLSQSDCEKLDASSCKDSLDCTYDSAGQKCNEADPAIKGTCAAIESDTTCASSPLSCTWYSSKSPSCEQKQLAAKINYFELSFAPAITTAIGTGNVKEITAIGRNGDGSRIYFGTMVEKEVASLDANNLATAASIKPLVAGIGDNSPGKAKFDNPADNTLIDKIVAGPGDSAVLLVSGVDTCLSGIVEMKAGAVRAAWRSNKAHLSVSVLDNRVIKSLTVFNSSWVAFQGSLLVTGAHFSFGDAVGIATAGPKGNAGAKLNKIITAAYSNGGDMYLASEGLVTKHSPVGKNLALNVNFTANKLMEKADFVITAGTANDEISALAMVGDYLLVGMRSAGAGTGGVALLKITDGSKTKAVHDQWDVKHIAVSADNKTALISTDQGLLFFYDGTLTEITNATHAALTLAAVTKAQPLAFANAIADAPDLDFNHTNVGAVNIDNTWYVATDNEGIFPISFQEKQK